jgi:hypothetical protein
MYYNTSTPALYTVAPLFKTLFRPHYLRIYFLKTEDMELAHDPLTTLLHQLCLLPALPSSSFAFFQLCLLLLDYLLVWLIFFLIEDIDRVQVQWELWRVTNTRLDSQVFLFSSQGVLFA